MTIKWLPFKEFEVVEELHGGSKRSFFRVKKNNLTYVVMRASIEEVERFKKIDKLLFERGINVPEVYDVRGEYILMEDVGSTSLYRLSREFGFNPEIYKKVIYELVRLQNLEYHNFPVFGARNLRNEYEQFKKYYALLHRIDTSKWEYRVDSAVKECMELEKVPMHRDFQSTNIYIKEGKVYFLDFQDMHMGPLYFDLAALLYDPYIMMQHDYKDELFEYYGKISGRKLDRERYLSCAMLRIMQALSAYVRLSREGKEFFKNFIRKGECTLKNILRDKGFHELADSLR